MRPVADKLSSSRCKLSMRGASLESVALVFRKRIDLMVGTRLLACVACSHLESSKAIDDPVPARPRASPPISVLPRDNTSTTNGGD
jgi:hypothetical protein